MKRFLVTALAVLISAQVSAGDFNPQATNSKNVDVIGFPIVSGVESNKRIEFLNEEEELAMCRGVTVGEMFQKARNYEVSIYDDNGIMGYKMTFTVDGDRIDPRPRPIAFYMPSTYDQRGANYRIRAVVEFTPDGKSYQNITDQGTYILSAMCELAK